jgi:hypothetical protein
MRPLSGGVLLEAWERAAPQGALDRALTLLAAACPELDPEQLQALSIPERNLQLLRLRQMSFGPSLGGYLPCDSCGARLEFDLPIAPILERLERLQPRAPIAWTLGERAFSLRPVNSQDLLAVLATPDERSARRLLLERCLAVSEGQGSARDLDAVLIESDEQVRDRFDQLHQAAEVVCELQCPDCGRVANVDLDPGRFLWTEVRHAAHRLLGEVHELARAYGWSEDAIVSMTPQRRCLYLVMVRS